MLKNAVTLVTDGALGVGKLTVEKFLRTGAKVVLCVLPTSKGNEIAENYGKNVVFVPTDVSSEQDVTTVIETTKSTFGRLDVRVHCAETSRAFKTYDFNNWRAHKIEDFTDVLKVNAIGIFNVIRLSAGLIAENQPNLDGQRGVIINTSSYSSYDGMEEQAAYSGASAAIVGMTLPIPSEFSEHCIRVNTIVSGLFETPDTFREFLAETVIFPQCLGDPSKFAQLVEIVDNPLLNGASIRLDGGFRSFLYN